MSLDHRQDNPLEGQQGASESSPRQSQSGYSDQQNRSNAGSNYGDWNGSQGGQDGNLRAGESESAEPGLGSQQDSEFDPGYVQWRNEQMRDLDDDYRSWREEGFEKFSDEFSSWRSQRRSLASEAGFSGTDIGNDLDDAGSFNTGLESENGSKVSGA